MIGLLDRLVEVVMLDMTPTISLIEVLWTLPALFVWVRYLQRASLALRALRRLARQAIPPRLSLLTRERIRCQRFLALTVMAECLLLAGLVSMTQPPSIAALTGDPIALAVPLLFFVMEWTLIVKGELVDRGEQALVWLYRQEVPTTAEGDGDVEGYWYEHHC